MGRKSKSFAELLVEAVVGGVRAATDSIRNDLAETERLRAYIGEGAHDPGAIIYRPKLNASIAVKKYGPGTAYDLKNNTFIRGSNTGGSYGKPRMWTIHKNEGNYETLLVVHGTLSKGYRPGVGPTPAFTVTFAHRDSYFPHKDAMYQDEFPLDRFAEMLNASKGGGTKWDDVGKLVVIDNREAHRRENERLAALEKPTEVRSKNQAPNPSTHPDAVTLLAEPNPNIIYDVEARESRSSDGSRFSAKQAGDRDYHYMSGSWHDGKTGRDATLTLHITKAWRPGYGETYLVNVNRMYDAQRTLRPGQKRTPVGEAEFPIERLVPLINAYQPLAWRNEHLGHFIVVDTRSNPINYYYG